MKLIAENIYKAYPGRNDSASVTALNGVSVAVDEREFVCLLGPSGCGKSTLLNIFAGLEIPTKGRAFFTGSDDAQQPSTSMVFQQLALYPWMSIVENVAFPLRLAGVSKAERRERAAALLVKMQLQGFEERFPRELSGGMQQRVAIARALITDPQFMLMDEPFGALDAQTRAVLQEDLLRLWELGRKTIVFVTHDIAEAIALGDRTLVLSRAPAKVAGEHRITIPRPRDIRGIMSHPDFASLYQRIRAQVQ